MNLKEHINPENCVYRSYMAGHPETEAAIQALGSAIEECRNRNISKILLDYQSRTSYPAAVERIIVATELAALYKKHLENGGNPIKFALFTRKDMITKDFQPGLEVAQLQELDLINTDDAQEILEWLDT